MQKYKFKVYLTKKLVVTVDDDFKPAVVIEGEWIKLAIAHGFQWVALFPPNQSANVSEFAYFCPVKMS